MQKYAWLLLLTPVMSGGELTSEKRAGKSKPDDKMKSLEGRWAIVEGYIWLASPGAKLEGGRSETPEVEIEFIGNVGEVRNILEDGSRSTPAPFAYLVDTSTDAITCDQIGYPISRGRPPHVITIGIIKLQGDKLYIALTRIAGLRPKSFDIANDPTVGALMICQRVKP